ncbi:MAG: DUF1302 family protein [Porticoccaceae bacterium]
MVRKNNTSIMKVGGLLLGFGGLMAAATPAMAVELIGDTESDFSIKFNGYARATAGMLLEDHDETAADDKWRLNQARATVNIDWDIKTGPLNWRVVTRFEQEHQTDYLDDLEDRINETSQTFGGSFYSNYGKDGRKGDFMEQYETTDEVMDMVREIYFDWAVTDRLFVRIGRQQLVWGESDFFQAMDVVHGYDYRGRLFYENNEEWRKPLFLFNFNLDVYELGGSLNWFIRPGKWDRNEDMGSNYNAEGGRWIPHPYRGVDFSQFTGMYDTDHKAGDWDKTTYGIRWNGTWGSVGYSFSYMKAFVTDIPVMNPDPSMSGNAGFGLNGVTVNSYVEDPKKGKLLGDWIFPEIDIFGFSMNYFSMALDSTLSAEVAYVPHRPYNYGALDSDLPGWEGVVEKDVMKIMLRIDKEFKWMDVLGTHRPSLSSMQLFDTWIMNYDDDDEIVEFASFGSKKKEHTVYLTFFTLLNYTRDTINPSFVIGTDLSNGGGFAIPAVEFVWGDDWRLKVEADLWWSDGDEKKICGTPDTSGASALTGGMSGCGTSFGANWLGEREHSASLMDWFADDNQIVVKLTRQF